MTDKERLVELADILEAELSKVGSLPICPQWMYESIRHCNRNMDFEWGDGFNEPERYAGGPIARIINHIPFVIEALRARASEAE